MRVLFNICGWLAAVAGGIFASAKEPARSSSIVLTADGQIVCTANQDSGSISLWRWQSDEAVREVPVGDEPRTLAVSPDGHFLYVANQRSQTLGVVDAQAGRCVDQIPIGGQPVAVVLSPEGDRAFVTQYAGDYIAEKYVPGAVAVVDLPSRTVARRIAVRAHPYAMAASADGKSLYVTHYFQLGGQGIVTAIDTEDLRVEREFVLDEDPDAAGGRGGVFNAMAGIAVHPEGKRALVVGMHANVHRGVTQSGMPLSHKTTVQAAVAVLDLEAGRELAGARIISSFSGQAVAVPVAVAMLGDGQHFLDVYFASHDFKVIKYNERGLVAERALVELPAGPTGVAVTRDGRTALFNCRWERSVVQVSLANVREPVVERTMRVATETWNERRLLGAKVFHNTRDSRMTPNRWLSCGICHLDGAVLPDGLIWEFTSPHEPDSAKLLNTKSLAITAWSQPPLLISGKYRTVQEEDQFVRSFLGGSGFIPYEDGAFPSDPAGKSPEMDAVAEFVLALRPRPNPHLLDGRPRPEIRASAERGRAIFFSDLAGCADCHSGPYLTQSGGEDGIELADVGTGLSADVPSLVNVWETAPYLHDGRARSLREVINKYNQEDNHGTTSHLSDSDITDLVNFMLAPFGE